MRRGVIIVLAVFISLGCALAHAQDTSSVPPISIRISGPPAVKSGQDIVIKVAVVNNGNIPFRLPFPLSDDEAERVFNISVDNQYGESAQKTTYGLGLEGKADPDTNAQLASQEFRSGIIVPGGSLEQSSVLNNMYKLSNPGLYLVRVTFSTNKMRKITSNLLRVTVIK